MKPSSLAALLPVVALALAACGSSATGGSGSDAGPTAPRAAVAPGQETAAIAAVNGLGLDLLRLNLGEAKGNVALSPFSIAAALGMARAGAGGTTAAEMDGVLHTTDAAALHAGMNALLQALDSRNGTFPGGDGKDLVVQLHAADRAFVQQGLALLDPFVQTLAADYGSTLGTVDYAHAAEKARRTINAWVAERTKDRIPELLAEGTIDGLVRLVLVNAVYLKADWAVPFEKEATKPDVFHAPGGDVSVPFMHGAESWGWHEGDGWQAVTLPYVGNALAMTVLVPAEGRFDQVVAGLDDALLRQLTAPSPGGEVILSLPKFDIGSALQLDDQLRALGMRAAFDPTAADFRGITTDEQLYVSAVVHQATITVDEQGTEAAAATAVIARAASAVLETHRLTVDRPFVFLLHDIATGALLFAGQVTDPS